MKNLLLLLSFSLFLVACGNKEDPQALDSGYLKENTYFNEFLGISIQVPDTWFIQNEEQLRQITETGSATFKANDDMTDRAIRETLENRTHNLFAAFKYELGSPVRFNSNIVLVAEDISIAPGVKSGKDYHFHVKNLLQNSNMQVSFPAESYDEQFGPYAFDAMPLDLAVNGVIVKQVYYATVKDRYVLSIIVSYGTDEQFEELQTILGSLKAIN